MILNVFFIILVAYYPAISTTAEIEKNNPREKRQDDERWTWGYVESTSSTSTTVNTTPTAPITQEVENPCKQKPLQTPNFSIPGMRISEQKCKEYIWGIQQRIEKKKRQAACDDYIVSRGGLLAHPEVFGGRDVLPGEFPHMGAIGWQAITGTWIYKCGASLISHKFALTAAHCSRASDRDTEIADPIPKIIRFGDKNIGEEISNGPVYTGNIEKIIVHPQYKSPKKYNDIALMQLDQNMLFNKNIQPACLWYNFDTSVQGKKASVTGWGLYKASSSATSPILQVANVDIIDSKTCDDLLKPNCNRHWCGIQETQVCAGKLSGGVDTCQGDSGGPLQFKISLPSYEEGAMHYVIGVTSFGFGCALENTPGVYTRVQPFLDWIESIVWPQA